MAYADAANYNQIKSMKGFPVGSIIPWSGSQDFVPTGWIICNGATISTTRYPLLYEVIGNTYGGTEGSTFRLPPLTTNNKAIVDMYKGYYFYLKGGTNDNSFPRAAHGPQGRTINDSPFWLQVGNASNGDEGGSNQTSHISTIDVVGEIAESPNFVAEFGDITLTTGEESASVSFNPRKLSDVHMPAHAHALDFEGDSNKWRQLSRSALKNNGDYRCGKLSNNFFKFLCFDRPPCMCRTSRNSVSRARRYVRYGNDQGAMKAEFGAYGSPAGGGGDIDTGIPIDQQEIVILFYPGDGYSRPDMFSHSSAVDGTIFWSSLSNAEVSYAQIAGHTHGSNTYNFKGNLSVVNPGIVTNVSLNNVTINNSSGVNFGTITVNSATPNLSMLYIIKAF